MRECGLETKKEETHMTNLLKQVGGIHIHFYQRWEQKKKVTKFGLMESLVTLENFVEGNGVVF